MPGTPQKTTPSPHSLIVFTTLSVGRFDKVCSCVAVAHALRDRAATAGGAALQELGRDEEAQAAFDRALLLAPDNGELLGNRGAALLRTRRFDEALDCLDRALASRPADAGILSNRGNALLGLGRHADAIETYDRALALAPENALTLNNRGAALNEIGLHERALTSLDDAVAVAPDYAEAWYNRGNALKGGKRIADALASYERALAIGTPLPHALSGCAECAAKLCDWKRTAQVEPELQSHVLGGQSIVSPFTLIGYGASPALQLAAARRHAAHRFPTLPPAMCRNTRRAHDRLRVAYLSANFNRHAMGYLMANLFERHDRSRFEITGISFGPDDGSAIRARIAAAFERFHDVRGVADRDVAKLLDEREIDIAVDVMGYTKDARPGILSHRPAPIQVNYLGYPGTMGADFIDYIMADAVLLPPAADAFCAEKVVRLPDCYQVTDRERPIAETVPSRKEAGLPEQGFVFCSFNNTYKITAAMFDVWMGLLAEFDGSVLWLVGDDANAEDNLRREAAVRGIAPGRLVFAPRMEQAEHLARHRLADLFLDTLPYNAHTTGSDALWAGLPILTCRGESFAGRVAASLLQAVGLPELVTASLADYAALARWLVQDRDLLGQIRQRLAENRLRAPLFDTDLSRRHIEAAYAAMWRLHRDGKPPQSFSVEPWHGIDSARKGIAA
jgi:protein O-GlcNAc transferase